MIGAAGNMTGAYPWWKWLAPLPGYNAGAVLGALCCEEIAKWFPIAMYGMQYVPDHDPLTALTLFVQFGAVAGGLIVQLGMSQWAPGPRLWVAAGVMSFLILLPLLPSTSVGTRLLWLTILALPWVITLRRRLKR
jgi:hypothetical protein